MTIWVTQGTWEVETQAWGSCPWSPSSLHGWWGIRWSRARAEVPPHTPHRFRRLAATSSQQGPEVIRTKCQLLSACGLPGPGLSTSLGEVTRRSQQPFEARCSSHYLETKQAEAWRELAAELQPRTQL